MFCVSHCVILTCRKSPHSIRPLESTATKAVALSVPKGHTALPSMQGAVCFWCCFHVMGCTLALSVCVDQSVQRYSRHCRGDQLCLMHTQISFVSVPGILFATASRAEREIVRSANHPFESFHIFHTYFRRCKRRLACIVGAAEEVCLQPYGTRLASQCISGTVPWEYFCSIRGYYL